MKKIKNTLLLMLPLFIFVFTFIGMYYVNKSYAINSDTAVVNDAIASGTVYQMERKNTYSWHLITHNFNSFSSTNASGTKLIRTKDKVGDTDDYAYAVVFCAEEGKTLSQSSKRTRYAIDNKTVTKKLSSDKRTKLKTLMPYMYPYITLGSLKSELNGTNGIGDNYSKYNFDKLTVQEAITASQAAIWNIQKGYTDRIYYSYRGTISSFGAFSSCENYHKDKVITSEEQAWYNASGCDKNGDFYKNVFNHTKDDNTKNRIDTLIKWYVLSLQSKLPAPTTDTFRVESSSIDASNKLTVKLDTNMTSYSVSFVDENNNTLLESNNTANNEYVIENVPSTSNVVTISVKSNDAQNHIFYYVASSGQDFIGLEKTYYSDSDKVILERPTPEPKKGKIIIYKVGNTDKNVEVSLNTTGEFNNSICTNTETGRCLDNAKFELYYGGVGSNNLYTQFEVNYSIANSYVFEDLPLGTYYLKETQPAYGYDLYNYGVLPVDANGFIKIEITDNQTFDVIVNNTSTKICFSKIDTNTRENLAKGRFLIYDIDGSIIEDFSSSANVGQEQYCLNGQLQTGSYFIREIEAPSGYALDSTTYHFTIGKEQSDISTLQDIGTYKEATVVNNVITFTNTKLVSISKSDASTGECVAGAKLIVRDSNGEIVKDRDGNTVGEWISTCTDESDNSGEPIYTGTCTERYSEYTGGTEIGSEESGSDTSGYICTDTREADLARDSYRLTLDPGTYTLTEVMTDELKAKGYSSKPETISFTVKEDGTVEGKTNMEDNPINVCIYKTNKDKTKTLAGAKFNIYKSDGETLFTTFTSSENEKCLTYMPIGTYIVKETEAPEGYQISDEEITIEVVDSEAKQYFYVTDEVIAPKTDLDRTKTLIIVSIVFMVFGIGMVGYYGFKKKN